MKNENKNMNGRDGRRKDGKSEIIERTDRHSVYSIWKQETDGR